MAKTQDNNDNATRRVPESEKKGFFGSTMAALFPGGGFITSQYVAAFWGGILMMLTAYFGYKGLNYLSYVAVPAIAILSLVAVVLAVIMTVSYPFCAKRVMNRR